MCLTLYPPSFHRSSMRGRNINLLSIGFPQPKLGLSLGHASPSDDCHCGGNLRLSAVPTLTALAVTHSNILTSHRSTELHSSASPQMEALLYHVALPKQNHIRDFGTMLSPGTFSAHDASLKTLSSELLRTL